MSGADARVAVEPTSGLISQPRTITLSGFTPGSVVTIEAHSTWTDGTRWQSHTRFLADAQGAVDPRVDMPLEGYGMPSAMGIVWSMQPDNPSAMFPPSGTTPLQIEISASDAAGCSASASLEQTFIAPGVTVQNVQSEGVSGELYQPAGPGPHPVMVYMNGSSGGIHSARAALFAAQGYACLALGVFNCAGRPRYISRTPLEYFENALQWVHRTLAPAQGFVALAGISRGSEMSLLSASYFPQLVSAVVGYVPTSTLNGVCSAGRPDETRSASAWTWQGQDLPNVWEPSATADWTRAVPYKDEGVRQTPAFLSTLEDPQAVARASIPVENIRCPVLLLSASDDGFWPSTVYAQQVARRMKAPYRHIDYRGAGHYLFYPGLPTTVISKRHAMSGMRVSAGGSPEANALANEAAERDVLQFLDDVRSGRLAA
jgi:pimeloyl-ACP methyl ester carboxylesterase